MTQTIDPQAQTVVGQPTRRQDAPDKLTGRARFVGDLPFPGLLHARLVLSPYGHARIRSIDTSAAKNIPGVVAVYTAGTLKLAHANSSSRQQSPLAQEEVYWCGHPVAVVLGESEEAAQDGVFAVEVDYDLLPVVIDPVAAFKLESPLARSRNKDEVSEIAGGGAHAAVSEENDEEEAAEALSQNVSDKAHIHTGDIEAGFSAADVIVERTYGTRPVHQSYLETQSITVVPSPSGHHLTVWPSTQTLFGVRADIAQAVNLPPRQVRVESAPIGGAFGGKFGLHEPLAAALAMQIRRPVRLVYTRQEDLLAGNPAPQTVVTIKMGAKRDGTLVALQAHGLFDTGAYPGASAGLGCYILISTYRCPNMDVRGYEVLTNKVGVGAYRAPDAPQMTFALESTVDELCHQLGMDGVTFRAMNAHREGDPTDAHGGTLPHIGILECLEQVKQHPLWKERATQKESPAEHPSWKIGVGLSVGGWPGGTEPAAAACRLEADGTVTVVIGTVDLTGSDTSLALIAAQTMGLSSDVVNVAHDNTDTMPYSGGTGGSKTTYSMGPAVIAAAQDARNQLLAVAGELLEAAAEDLEIENGKVIVKGVPGKSIELAQVAASTMRFAGQYEPVYGRGRAAVSKNSPMFSAHLARVAVDTETGEVHVLDYIAVQDVGRAINPAEVEGQIQGGVTQGIGWALFEGFEYDENGQLLTSTLMDYALPHSEDVPNIASIMLEIPSALGPFGAKGVGEPPVVPVAGAIANAIYDAVGARVTQLPMTPERVFNAMHTS
ncbi:MAG: xanthine dehydrogenase family protein molybdopterin-binding subunit [Ktedonobacteraceae bacterium]|nr:xanthine dehydrogenase family protein molybdopterin-binding subunit [Ktedonobacteraceae bacterium]